MSVGRPTVVFARHWRREVADVADTLRAVVGAGPASAKVVGGSRFPGPADLARRADVLVVSDTQAVPAALRRRLGDPVVLRLWWNAADEVIEHVGASAGAAADDVHVVFFSDVAEGVRAAGLEVLLVPYAFTPPQAAASARTPQVGYTGELDVTDGCFAPHAEAAGTTAAALGERARDLAARIVAGERTLVDVDAELATSSELAGPLVRTMGWSVRNHVRHALVVAVRDAVGDRLALRGDDWAAVGLPAAPTNFRRSIRMGAYRTHRVSLDLGSKSTNDALYPRSVDIMAVAGGLAQLHSGAPTPAGAGPMAERRAASATELVALVTRLLELPEDQLRAEDAALAAAYAELRIASGRQLLDQITRRTA